MYIQSIITHLKQYIMAIANDLRVFGIPIFAINEWELTFSIATMFVLLVDTTISRKDSLINYIDSYSTNLIYAFVWIHSSWWCGAIMEDLKEVSQAESRGATARKPYKVPKRF